jgi:hypothetical protein
VAQKTFIEIDTSDVDAYISYLKKKNFKGLMRGVTAITRQGANDIKNVYKPLVPKSGRSGKTKAYGFRSGNLRRSLRIFKKRQRNDMIVEFSVGFKKHKYGELQAKLSQGKRITDGYYGAWVDSGVAGRQRGKPNKGASSSAGFRERAKRRANMRLKMGMSNKAKQFLTKRMNKELNGRI